MKAWVEKGAHLGKAARRKTRDLTEEKIHSILVIRHAALGDMIQTRPFLVELKKLFPQSSITLSLISNYQYAAPLDLVDHVHVIEGSDKREISILKRFQNFKSLPAYDLLFDLACTSRSKMLTFFTAAKLKLSFPYKKNLFLYDVCLHRSDFRFEAENLLEFLFYFGHQPSYPIDYQMPQNNNYKNSKDIYCFFGASNPNRCYPIEEWFMLLKKLSQQFADHTFYILNGTQESENYEKKIHALEIHNIKPLPSQSLSELSKKLLKAKLFISNDTGLRHLAIAHRTPTVGFFTNTCPGRNLPTYEDTHLLILEKNSEKKFPIVEIVIDKISSWISKIEF